MQFTVLLNKYNTLEDRLFTLVIKFHSKLIMTNFRFVPFKIILRKGFLMNYIKNINYKDFPFKKMRKTLNF